MTKQLILEQNEHHFELAMPGRERWELIRGTSYSPLESVVAAAGACAGYVYQDILTNSKLAAEVMKVEVDYATHEGDVHALMALDVHFYVQASEAELEKARRYVKFVHRYCPVIQSLREDIEINDHVHWVEE
ncbi:MAG: OsmC family protein [Aerococcus sp.]|nr:OsmC family protein [Aerococcus sp.]